MTIISFDPVKIAAIVSMFVIVVQVLKKVFEWLEEHSDDGSWLGKVWAWWAHGAGPVVLGALVAVGAILPDIVVDGRLTLPEIGDILRAIGLLGGGNVAYLALRAFAFPKK